MKDSQHCGSRGARPSAFGTGVPASAANVSFGSVDAQSAPRMRGRSRACLVDCFCFPGRFLLHPHVYRFASIQEDSTCCLPGKSWKAVSLKRFALEFNHPNIMLVDTTGQASQPKSSPTEILKPWRNACKSYIYICNTYIIILDNQTA